MTEPLVRRVHGDRGVSEHCLGACRRDGDVPTVFEWIPDVVEGPIEIFVLHLEVGNRRGAPRAPVDEIRTAVDQVLLVQSDEDRAHGLGQPLVECEPEARPIARTPERFQLIDDLRAVLRLPLPNTLDERVAAELVTRGSYARKLLFDHVLRGNAGVVRSREPAGRIAPHSSIANHHILEAVVEGVAHVKPTRDIRGRDDDGERDTVDNADGGTEEVSLFPVAIDPRFHFRRAILLRQLHGHPP